MKKYSLFIGRYQPLHEGHKKIIQKVLDEKGYPLIALRDTGIDAGNPYTIEERTEMFRKEFGNKVRIITVPDIKEVCYGRKVGYDIRRIRLDKQSEEVSATKIRGNHKRIIWLTGNVGSGKTSIAYLLKERLDAIVLDGDEMRMSISLGAGYSPVDRHEHNMRVCRLARILAEQGHHVIISVIAPLKRTRKEITKVIDPFWVYFKTKTDNPKYIYEEPQNPDITIDKEKETIEDSMDKIIRNLIIK